MTVAIGHDASLLGNAVLSGTRTVQAVNGVARFSDLSIDELANGCRLRATAPGLRSADRAPFTIGMLESDPAPSWPSSGAQAVTVPAEPLNPRLRVATAGNAAGAFALPRSVSPG